MGDRRFVTTESLDDGVIVRIMLNRSSATRSNAGSSSSWTRPPWPPRRTPPAALLR
jgi:hypothetical protein